MTDALQLLRDDHKKVKELFDAFEQTEDKETKKGIVDTALIELEVHALLEEREFYPVLRRRMGSDEEGEELMDEADEEHHVAKVLINELMDMGPEDSHYDAKFIVLAENVKHHIMEEETEMLPLAAEAIGSEELQRLGERMAQRKQEIMQEITSGTARRTTPTRSSTNGRSTTSTRTRTTAKKSTGRVRATANKSNGSRTTTAKTGNGARTTGKNSNGARTTAKTGTRTRATAKSASRGRATAGSR